MDESIDAQVMLIAAYDLYNQMVIKLLGYLMKEKKVRNEEEAMNDEVFALAVYDG